MNVINLYESESYMALQKLIDNGFVTNGHLISPMRYLIKVDIPTGRQAQSIIGPLDEIFGEGVNTIDWVENYNAPWFYTICWETVYRQVFLDYRNSPMKKWTMDVNLTTDEQLSYYILSHGPN